MNAEKILSLAASAMQDRAKARDRATERSMARAVRAFNALFGDAIAARGGRLSEVEGWRFMEILKLARGEGADEFVDGAAYAALAGEAATQDDPEHAVAYIGDARDAEAHRTWLDGSAVRGERNSG